MSNDEGMTKRPANHTNRREKNSGKKKVIRVNSRHSRANLRFSVIRVHSWLKDNAKRKTEPTRSRTRAALRRIRLLRLATLSTRYCWLDRACHRSRSGANHNRKRAAANRKRIAGDRE